MGGVVDAIVDVVGDVVDAVGDAVEWVGDTASNIVEHALDNPVETALMVGLTVATGGAGAAALGLEAPLTVLEATSGMAAVSGASTLAHGGDLGDALTSAATTFAVAQGVNYAFDSFNAAGAPGGGGSGTTQFFDDGSSIQMFDDGSRLVTDTSGAVTPVPADETFAAGLQPSGAETTPIPEQGLIESTTLPPLETTTPPPTANPVYDTMEQLLVDKNLITPQEALAATAPPPVDITPTNPSVPQYETMEDLLYDKGELTDAQYKNLTGQAPVVDLSKPAEPMADVSTIDALKDLGGAAVDYAKENPWTTAAIVGGGAALTGALGNEEEPTQPEAPANKTYTYGPGAPINRTGLDELWSAASKIYGGDEGVMKQLNIQAPAATPFQSSFQPLLGGQAPGAIFGLGALGQGFSYTPMGSGQTFDISTLSPEQIIQLQQAVARKKPGEGA